MVQELLPGTFARHPTQMTRGLQFKQNCGCLRLHSHLRVSSAWPKLQFCRDNCSKVSNAAPCTPQLPFLNCSCSCFTRYRLCGAYVINFAPWVFSGPKFSQQTLHHLQRARHHHHHHVIIQGREFSDSARPPLQNHRKTSSPSQIDTVWVRRSR